MFTELQKRRPGRRHHTGLRARNGTLSFGRADDEALGAPERVAVLYDADDKVVRLAPSEQGWKVARSAVPTVKGGTVLSQVPNGLYVAKSVTPEFADFVWEGPLSA